MKNRIAEIVAFGSLALFHMQMTLFYLAYNPDIKIWNDFYFLSEKIYTFGFIYLGYLLLTGVNRAFFARYKFAFLFTAICASFRFVWVFLRVSGIIDLTDEAVSFYFIVLFVATFVVLKIRKNGENRI